MVTRFDPLIDPLIDVEVPSGNQVLGAITQVHVALSVADGALGDAFELRDIKPVIVALWL